MRGRLIDGRRFRIGRASDTLRPFSVIASQRVGTKRRPMTDSAKQSIARLEDRWLASLGSQ